MTIWTRRGWELPEAAATDETAFRNRRLLVKALAAGPILAAAAPSMLARAAASPYPVARNPRYALDREITDEKVATTYNNFYEFGSHKNIWRAAQKLKVRPWTVTIDGMVEREITIDAHELIARMPLEERLYRHRCVEAWSMAVPWSGFPLQALVAFARPSAGARYLEMRSFEDPEAAPGQRQFWYPWPYLEGMTLEEATNELAFIATGAYGREIPKQNGAPMRLVAPWKYGFKSVKSIIRFTFTADRPVSFWEEIQGSEYGFWANVNPDVPHPRWSQATERVLGTDERMPTLLYNGYGAYVAHLYKDMKGERLFM